MSKFATIEWAQWLDQVFTNKNYDLTIVSHTEPQDIDIYARDDYYFQYDNPAFQDLIAALRKESDPAKRKTLLGAAQRMIADDAVNVFIAQGPKIGVWKRGVSGIWRDAPVQANDLTAAAFTGRVATDTNEGSSNTTAYSRFFFVLFASVLVSASFILKISPRYILSRAALMVASLCIASILIFSLIELAPGDPAAFMMGLNADPQSVAALRTELGLDKSVPERYVAWISGFTAGDFGTSYTYRVPVADLIAERLWVSLPLASFAFLLAVLSGIPAGVIAAARKNHPAGKLIIAGAQAGISIPNFWLAILLVSIFAVGLGWFSAGGFPGWDQSVASSIKALLLPAIALAVPQAAIVAQVMRSSMLETLREDYIRTARAKGASNNQVIWNHAFRNALIPVLTILGLQFAFLIAGAILIENVFYLPGLGRLVFQAIAQRDLIVIEGVVIVLVFTVILANFLIDIAYAAVDPRLRRKATG